MSKKKRVFDIDFDADAVDVPAGTEGDARRGPMAAAITENAEALTERRTAEAAIRAENDALAHEHVRLKKAGLITDLIPIDAVRMDKLSRDRVEGRDEEIDDLKTSIREIGLSNPIRVEKAGDGYELIQGYRRLTAFRELFAETGDERFAVIPAGINAVGEDVQQLYRRMVDENMVRRGVSFAEMAQLAIAYAEEAPEVGGVEQAVDLLYASSGRQKRSYIKIFARLLGMIGDDLKHPQEMSRAVGLGLAKRLEAHPGLEQSLRQSLNKAPGRDAETEARLLSEAMEAALEPKPKKVKLAGKGAAKTTFRLQQPGGVAKCTVADGRVELRLDRDFSGVQRKTLEAAVAAFLAKLDD